MSRGFCSSDQAADSTFGQHGKGRTHHSTDRLAFQLASHAQTLQRRVSSFNHCGTPHTRTARNPCTSLHIHSERSKLRRRCQVTEHAAPTRRDDVTCTRSTNPVPSQSEIAELQPAKPHKLHIFSRTISTTRSNVAPPKKNLRRLGAEKRNPSSDRHFLIHNSEMRHPRTSRARAERDVAPWPRTRLARHAHATQTHRPPTHQPHPPPTEPNAERPTPRAQEARSKARRALPMPGDHGVSANPLLPLEEETTGQCSLPFGAKFDLLTDPHVVSSRQQLTFEGFGKRYGLLKCRPRSCYRGRFCVKIGSTEGDAR